MVPRNSRHANSPNTVISGSFRMRPSDGCGLSQTAVECVRNSPMEISVTLGETRGRRLESVQRRREEP